MPNAQMHVLGNRWDSVDELPSWGHYGSNYLQITGLKKQIYFFLLLTLTIPAGAIATLDWDVAGVKIPSLFKGAAGVTITALDCPWKAAEEHN